MFYVLKALGLWGLVMILNFLITSALASAKRDIKPPVLGGVSQVSLIVISLAVMSLTGTAEEYGLTINLEGSFTAAVISLPLALLLATLTVKVAGEYEPPFLPRNLLGWALLALILAPLGEELLFRGLLEGQLLQGCSSGPCLYLAITLPALLFSLVHVMPFSEAPRRYVGCVLVMAFIAGLVAGYFRAVSGSLLPAIVTHSSFNLAGKLTSSIIAAKAQFSSGNS